MVIFMDKKKKQENILLVIRQREKVIFDEEVKAFTSYNDRGVFDVLSKHANFVSIINQSYLIHKLDGTTNEMKIEQGIIRVYKNKVIVYLGIGR